MRRAVTCVLTMLVLSACGSASDLVASSSGPPTSQESESSEPTPDSKTAVTPSPDPDPPSRGLPKIVGPVRSFSSPSGNIGCAIDESSARCDIGDHSYGPPAEPDGCSGTWGTSLQVAEGAAAFVCVTDSTIGAKKVLEYGTSSVVGNYGCASRRTGVTCMNTETDHGFKISRAKVTVF